MKRIIISFCFMLFQLSIVLPAEIKYPVPGLDNGICPIRWSKNGYFAYALSNPCGNYGACISYDISVQNMVTDKKLRFIIRLKMLLRLKSQVNHLNSAISGRKTTRKYPRQYKILPAEIAMRSITSLKSATGNTIKVKEIKSNQQPHSDSRGYSLYAYNTKGKQKNIHRVESEPYNMRPEIAGYIKSLYENRIAIPVQEGIGGPENVTYYYLVGCQTQSDFNQFQHNEE